MQKILEIKIKPLEEYHVSIMTFISMICRLGAYNNKDVEKYKDKAYPYIPSNYSHLTETLSIINHLYPNESNIRIGDLGAGTGAFVACLSQIDNRLSPIGFELNPIDNIKFCHIIKQDILTITSKRLAEFDILYAYNPLRDEDLMFKALKHWIRIKPKKCVLIYTRTSAFKTEQNKWFERNFDRVGKYSQIFISKQTTTK